MADEYSLPLAPPDAPVSTKPVQHKPLRNEDFKKLMATPRVGGTPASVGSSSRRDSGGTMAPPKTTPEGAKGQPTKQSKKKHYSKQKKEEDDEDLTNILKNYRDRAEERRIGEGKQTESEAELMKIQSGYRAVGHDERALLGAAERRKQMIQESKYLGGDMEHTHLVKGLDYALLQKVRGEITSKEEEQELDLEKAYQTRKVEREETEANIKSVLARNIHRILFKNEYPKQNELFAPRRMAYVMELHEDDVEIPTTLIRSKADCPVEDQTQQLTTNDMVIQKLSQVLSYLRSDTKKRKKDKATDKQMKPEDLAKLASQGIYDDVGEYQPRRDKERSSRNNNDDKPEKRERNQYGESTRNRSRRTDERNGRDDERDRDRRDRDRNKREKPRDEVDDRLARGWAPADIEREKQREREQQATAVQAATTSNAEPDKTRPAAEKDENANKWWERATDGYGECYPSGAPDIDVDDSDEEAEFAKIDLTNKKGLIKRWDFEDEEQYSDYKSKQEAAPRAAYQYGLKISDGRKTGKAGKSMGHPKDKEKDMKNKLDREWTQISKILDKRKAGDDDGGAKRPKY